MGKYKASFVTEKAFLQTVIDVARLNGWLCYHTFDSRRSPAGYPDLVLVRGSEMIIAELKSEKGKLTAAQHGWLDALRAVQSVETFCWRPSQFDLIQAALERPREKP